MDSALNGLRDGVKAVVMQPIARALNRLSRGHITPAHITITGLLAHVPIAYCIAIDRTTLAAILLVIFGLFDALDGTLARLQNRVSAGGMLLDAVTDRMKEIIIYIGTAYLLVTNGSSGSLNPAHIAAIVVAACGGSVLVSYVNAWGETVMAKAGETRSSHAVNQTFRGGLMRFEVRMFILIVGLLTTHLLFAVCFIAIMAWYTAFSRLVQVSKRLS